MKFLVFLSLLIGILLLIIAFYNFIVFVGFRKNNVKNVNGYLQSTKSEKNVFKGGRNGRLHKNWVNYVYSYRVDEKSYTISGGISGTKQNLNTVVKVIYQKKHPEKAYIKNLTFPMQIIYAILVFVIAMMLIIPSILYLI